MSASNKQGKEPIVYVRKRIHKTKTIEELVATVVALPAQQGITGQKRSRTSHIEPKKKLEKKEAKSVRKGRAKNSANSSSTRRCKGAGAGNAKISDNLEDKRKTWKPQTEQETDKNQLVLVDDENIDYVGSQLEFVKDLGETAQRVAYNKACSLKKALEFAAVNNNNTCMSSYNDKGKGKEVQQERNNNPMDLTDFYAQRGNKGIIISEKSVDSRSQDMPNNQFSGQKLQVQDMTSLNQVSPNYFLSNSIKEMNAWTRHHKPRIVVHPTKIIGPSRFRQNYDQDMQRTSWSPPPNFSFMKLLMEGEDSSILANDLYEKQLLSTLYGGSSQGQRVQQQPCSQVGNYQYGVSTEGQRMQQLPSSQVGNYQHGVSSEGQKAQQGPHSQVGNYQHGVSSEGQKAQQGPHSQVGNYQHGVSSEGQRVLQGPYSQVGNYQHGVSSQGQKVQQQPSSQVGNYPYTVSSQGQRVQQQPSQVGNHPYGVSSQGQRVQQQPNQVGIHPYSVSSQGQRVQKQPSSQVGNYPYGVSSQGQWVQQQPSSQVGNYPYSVSSQGQRVQKQSSSQVGSYPYRVSSEGQRVQQWPRNQVGNNQYSVSSEGQRVQHWPRSQVANYQYGVSSEGQRVQQWPRSQVGNYQYGVSSGQKVQQWPCSSMGNYQYGISNEGQKVQQGPNSQVGNYQYENSLEQINLQSCENQVLEQPQQISFMDLLTREDISWI